MRKKLLCFLICYLISFSVYLSGCCDLAVPPIEFRGAAILNEGEEETFQNAALRYSFVNISEKTITGFSGSYYLYPKSEDPPPALNLPRKFTYNGSISPGETFLGYISLDDTGLSGSSIVIDQFCVSTVEFGAKKWKDYLGMCIYPGTVQLWEDTDD
jgi:hypothetical protein